MSIKTLLLAACAAAAISTPATAQADVITHNIGQQGGSPNAIIYYGQANGLAAYSVATQSCNIGDANLTWTTGDGQSHPVISQNLFRLKDGRFEQLGQSWLKHGFCALCESGCGPGSGIGCNPFLAPGCADTYSADLNDGSAGGPKYMVDPTAGDHLHPDPFPVGHVTLKGRLQARVTDLEPGSNPGARYFLEGMYVHVEDSQAGKAANNAAWREAAVNANLTISTVGPTISGASAVYGWQSADPLVDVAQVTNLDEGGPGVHGYLQVASRVFDNGDGTWDYVYVVYNQNSKQGVGAVSVPYAGGATLSDWFFNDVDYHSGEVQDGTDWSGVEGASEITWTCPQTFAQNPDANAINWATGYTFGFTADLPPGPGVGELTLFEPGVGDVLLVPLDGPGGGPSTGTPFCYGDGTGTACPCANAGAAGEGCANSSGQGARLIGFGAASVANDSLQLHVSGAAHSVVGLFFGGTAQSNAGAGQTFGDGLLCAVGTIKRLEIAPTNPGGGATSILGISALDGAQSGQTRYYQYWFRDPGGGAPCGSGFNTSQALAIDWQP